MIAAILRAARIGRTLRSVLTVTDEDGDAMTCTGAALLAANVGDADLMAAVLFLTPGGVSAVGGGAAPFVTIARAS